MKLLKVFRNGDIAPQEYVTEDQRYYINKNPDGPGWRLYNFYPDGKICFNRIIHTLKEARELL